MSFNKVFLIGNLGADPELRDAGDTQICNFRIATSESWKDKSGQRQERTEWHRVCVFGKSAESCGEYLRKGRTVHVEGQLRTRDWEDRDGNKRYTTEVVVNQFNGRVTFLGGRNAEEPQAPMKFAPKPTLTDDDIPF